MNTEYEMPFYTEATWIIGILVVLLIIFDLILIRWCKLGKTAWKRIDYIWLSAAAIGLIGTVEVSRNSFSDNMLSLAERRMLGQLSEPHFAAKFGTGPSICRTFIRSEFSPSEPEFSNVQREYDVVCGWFTAVVPLLPKKLEEITEPIAMTKFPAIPRISISDEALHWSFSQFSDAVSDVNQQLEVILRLHAIKQREIFEDILRILSPLILTIALALRIAKVTAEIKNQE